MDFISSEKKLTGQKYDKQSIFQVSIVLNSEGMIGTLPMS